MHRKRKPLTQLPVDRNNTCGKRIRSNSFSGSSYDDCVEKSPGTIEKIVLRNFMCHSLLEISFNKNICFVTGKNGSGKSAILTALIVGLGGRANLTNRGNSIKNFIKAGKNSATIEITFRNSGPLAYQSNVYGNKIIITRNFYATGASSYKVKSESGQIITTQLKDIQQIKNHLNIQVDNPVCILNQDTSRNFLSTSDSKQRFLLFMKATRLDALHEATATINSNKKNSVRLWKEKDVEFKKLEEDVKNLKTKLETHKSLVGLKNNIKHLKRELLWAIVRDVENEHQQQQNVVDAHAKECSELEELKDTRIRKIESIKEQISSLQQQVSEIKSSIDNQNKPQADLKQNLNCYRENFNEKRRQKHLLQISLEAKKSECQSLEKEIADISKNIQHVEDEKAERAKNLAKVTENIKKFDDVLQTARNDLFQSKSDFSRKSDDIKNVRVERQQINENIVRQKDRLNALQRESNNGLLLYGRNMPQIILAINAMKEKFGQVPRGPIGSYITLNDKKWAVAVEGFLGPRFLHAFIVDNKRDNTILMRIFDRICDNNSLKPMIITTKFFHSVHNVARNLVRRSSDCISLYEALKISDPVVANCIIDQMAPEGILLIPSNERAIELMSDRQMVPVNCKQGVTMKGEKYYPDPHYKTYSSNYHRAQYLQTNVNEQVDQIKEQINKLENSKASITNQLFALEKDINEQQEKQIQLEEKVKKLSHARDKLREQHNRLLSLPEPETVDAQILQNELEDLRRDINTMTVTLENTDKEINQTKRSIDEIEQKFCEMKQLNNSLQERVRPLEEQIGALVREKNSLMTDNEFTKNHLDENKNRLNIAKSELLKIEVTLNEKSLQACKVCERMDDIRQVPDIDKKINDIEKKIRLVESDNENAEDISARYQLSHGKFKELSEMMNALHEDVTELENATEKRKRHYKLTEGYFITYTKLAFEQILEQRQFSGSIEIDLNDKNLDLIVIPQQGSQGLTTTANLSGGERSFSTVSFLYSLWQCMNFPFYILDEFDVYMDKLNRTKVMEILLDYAKTRPECQYVFLTPQDVSFVHDESVDIHRLEDPVRLHVQN